MGAGCSTPANCGVQGAGHIKVNLHRPLEGTVKTVTIKREAGRWFACFSVEREAQPLPASDRATGIGRWAEQLCGSC
jgi:putative transposase